MTNEEQQKHEAAIETWRKEAMSLSPRSYHVDHPRLRVLRVGEIDAICDLARRAPRPEPERQPLGNPLELPATEEQQKHEAAKLAWWHNINDALLSMDHSWVLSHHEVANPFGRLQKHQAVFDLLNKGLVLMGEKPASDPKPEPRASSALLGAAKRAYESCPMSCGSSKRELDHLRSMNDLYVAIEAEEARGPSEVDDPDWHQTMTNWLKRRDEGPTSNLAAVVATLVRRELARGKQPPQPNHASDDNPLREWLETYDPDGGILTTIKQDEAAFAELCRRELARGAK